MKYLRLLHDNPIVFEANTEDLEAEKVSHCIRSTHETEYLMAEKVIVLPHLPFSPDLSPCDFFLFPELKFHLCGRNIQITKSLGSAIYMYMMGAPIEEYEIVSSEKCIQARVEYFEEQG
jgi:hypothetical protein